ncbi:unnamed protein product [Moneuplotes crassus]|uniref:Uncharacterized protein n=1 Tax=Euplotes crassus TaxID=5936 RepID=A0AAD1X957_EUPCR|nr:unnamed protein product [Moneuplotes crassus]
MASWDPESLRGWEGLGVEKENKTFWENKSGHLGAKGQIRLDTNSQIVYRAGRKN